MMKLAERNVMRAEILEVAKGVDFREGFEFYGQTKDGMVFMNKEGDAFTVKVIAHTEKVDVVGMVEEYELNQKEKAAKAAEKEAKAAKRKAKETKETAEVVEDSENEGE